MINKFKNILAAAVLVAAFFLGWVAGWMAKPGADARPAAEAPKVTVNPTDKQVKKADVAVKVESQGRLTGSTKLTKRSGSAREVVAHPEQSTWGESTGLTAGESVTVPVSGTITAKYIDAKTGEPIGEGTRPVSGETSVQVDGDQVKVDTKFDDEVTFAIEIPEPPKRLWHAGGMSFWSRETNQMVYDIYIQRDWVLLSTKKADWVVWARGEMALNGDNDRQVMVGVERRW